MREPAAPPDGSLEAIRERSRYEDFLRSTVDWVWETDPRLSFVYVSRSAARRLGVPAQSLIGRSLFDLGAFEPTRDRDSDGRAAIEARRPFRNAAFSVGDPEGRRLRFRLSGIPAFDETTGRFAGYRGTAVAETKETSATPEGAASEEELRALARTLEETLLRHQELSWRLANVERAPSAGEPGGGAPRLARTAHELRTPLNA
ncbi:MAG TPA: PAS domain-containing protein, partial [Kiloniellales bacterium]|nr:PAS domain-containing protein [Kiloniellales bacterium]